MANINTVPEQIDVTGYGGDTLSVRINVTGAAWTTPVWTAQVRATRAPAAPVDATFAITTDAGGAWIVLSAALTASLLAKGPDGLKYAGQWDVQVQDGEVVTTLAQGSITIEADVTRGA